LAATFTLPPGPGAAEASQATEEFDSAYGADVKRVRATATPKDDIELAARLVALAKSETAKPESLAVLCENAYELAMVHPDGYATAAQAMELEAAKVPANAAACGQRRLDILQKVYDSSRGPQRAKAGEALTDALLSRADLQVAAAEIPEAVALCKRAFVVARVIGSAKKDVVEERLKQLGQMAKTSAEADALKKQLEKDPANTALREKLVRLLLVGLGNPAEAAKCLEGVSDAPLLKYVPAAAKPVDEAPEMACPELGDWYVDLGRSAAAAAKPAVLARAVAYYGRFLLLHTDEDLLRGKVVAALKKTGEDLWQARGEPWVDLLALVDPVKDSLKGAWQRQGSALVSPDRGACMTCQMPAAIEGSYELQIRLVRLGGDAPNVFLPVQKRSVQLIVCGYPERIGGLTAIGGKQLPDNPTLVPGVMTQAGRECLLTVKVTLLGASAEINATLDGKPFVSWQGPVAALSLSDAWPAPTAPCVAVGCWWSTAKLTAVRLKAITGTAKPLR
jgi:hypothetical protein